MAINKIALDGTTLIDLSTDTVASSDDIVQGKVGHLNDGSVVTGTASSGGGTDGQFFPINMAESVTPTISLTSLSNTATMISIANGDYIENGNFYKANIQHSLYYCDFGKTLTNAIIVATKTVTSNRFRFAFFNEDPSTFTTDKNGIGYYPPDENSETPAGTQRVMKLEPPYAARYMAVTVSNQNRTTPAPTVVWAEI